MHLCLSMRDASTFSCNARMISIICAIVMAPSAATGTTGLERVLLIFLMKNQQIKLQRTKPSPANNRSSNQSVKNSQTPKNFPERNHNSTPIDSDAKPSQKLAISAQTYCFSTKTPDSPVRNTNEW